MDAAKTHLQSWQRCQPPDGTTDMKNYEDRPFNKLLNTAMSMMNQHTWKCTTKSDTVWQNWVVEGTKGIICKAEYFCTAAVLY